MSKGIEMYGYTLLAALLISPAPAAHQATHSSEPLTISIGAMSVSGDTVKLTKTTTGIVECVIAGNARWAIGHDGDTDMSIIASRISVQSNRQADHTTIKCQGVCKLNDSDYTCSAKNVTLILTKSGVDIEMSGDVQVQYSKGDRQTTLTCKSIKAHNGVFRITGDASLTTAP